MRLSEPFEMGGAVVLFVTITAFSVYLGHGLHTKPLKLGDVAAYLLTAAICAGLAGMCISGVVIREDGDPDVSPAPWFLASLLLQSPIFFFVVAALRKKADNK